MPMDERKLPPGFFLLKGENIFEPTEATIGPWSADLQHGGPPCALLAFALRTFPGPDDFQVARLTIEFLGPVPVKPCEIKVTRIRQGKRIELLRGEYLADGKCCLVASAWRLQIESGSTNPLADDFQIPEIPPPQEFRSFPGISYFPYGDALEWRFTQGGYDSLGPATVWTRPRIPLVAGHDLHGLEALILMVDSANGISAELDIREWTFVPVDLTIGLYRQPGGEWTGMSARTVMGSEGIGQSSTVVFDCQGKVGQSLHTLFIRPKQEAAANNR